MIVMKEFGQIKFVVYMIDKKNLDDNFRSERIDLEGYTEYLVFNYFLKIVAYLGKFQNYVVFIDYKIGMFGLFLFLS